MIVQEYLRFIHGRIELSRTVRPELTVKGLAEGEDTSDVSKPEDTKAKDMVVHEGKINHSYVGG